MPKKPFSGKQKKDQLREKRERVAGRNTRQDEGVDVIKLNQRDGTDTQHEKICASGQVQEIPIASKKDKQMDPNRYKLHFLKESKEELQERRRHARLPLTRISDSDLEMGVSDFNSKLTQVLDMPKRPPWDYSMSREKLERQELQYFRDYTSAINKEFRSKDLSYFELNLETWRQLWRVLEFSDIILLIVDVRYPLIHFPPSLYHHVTKELQKQLIMIINKVDLAPAPVVAAWISYFSKTYPDLNIVCFSSFPKTVAEMEKDAGKNLHRKRVKRPMSEAGPRQLVRVCQDMVKGSVNLSSWIRKLDKEDHWDEEEEEEEEETETESKDEDLEVDTSYHEHIPFKDGTLTLGCCGFPNVGKSTVMNALIGKKVVSVSKTPGHTKHFQTYFLTDDVILCDCPGLVFPSQVDRPLQILSGMYPVSQVQEPYTAVGYLAQRLDLPKLLRLQHPDEDQPKGKEVWSAMDMCDGWADKRGFKTARGARSDTYRAANEILRLSIEGKLVICFRPPGYTEEGGHHGIWASHEITKMVSEIQIAKKKNEGDEDMVEDGVRRGGSDKSDGSEDDSEDTLIQNVGPSTNVFALLGDESDDGEL